MWGGFCEGNVMCVCGGGGFCEGMEPQCVNTDSQAQCTTVVSTCTSVVHL